MVQFVKAEDVKSCLYTFAEQSNIRPLYKVVLGIGCVACFGFVIHMGKIQREMSQIYPKRETLAFVVFSVALAVLITLSFFLNQAKYPALFLVLSSFIIFFPYKIADWVYPKKHLGIF